MLRPSHPEGHSRINCGRICLMLAAVLTAVLTLSSYDTGMSSPQHHFHQHDALLRDGRPAPTDYLELDPATPATADLAGAGTAGQRHNPFGMAQRQRGVALLPPRGLHSPHPPKPTDYLELGGAAAQAAVEALPARAERRHPGHWVQQMRHPDGGRRPPLPHRALGMPPHVPAHPMHSAVRRGGVAEVHHFGERPEHTARQSALPNLDGVWRDEGSGDTALLHVGGGSVTVKRGCSALESGNASGTQLFLFGLTGEVSDNGNTIDFSNDVTWVRVSNTLPPEHASAMSLGPPLEKRVGVCPGVDTDAYVAKARVPFHLCTHGMADLVSSRFIASGAWGDCQHLPSLLWMLRDVSGSRRVEVVEVGGNIGTCSMVMAGEGARVTTFEPLPQNLAALKRSVELNEGRFEHGVRVVSEAVGRIAGSVRIKAESGNLGNSVVSSEASTEGKESADEANHVLFDGRRSGWLHSETIQMTTIDTHVQQHVHFLKLDCQGYELDALMGATDLFARHGVDLVRTEFDTQFLRQAGRDPLDLLLFFSDKGYAIVENGVEILQTDFRVYAARGHANDIYAVRRGGLPRQYWCYLR